MLQDTFTLSPSPGPLCRETSGPCVVMRHRPVMHVRDTDPPGDKRSRAVERLPRMINNEHACHIMKEVCLQSGISGLTFDPDSAAMFSTSKSSCFNRKASWKQQCSFFLTSPSLLSWQPQANLTPLMVT